MKLSSGHLGKFLEDGRSSWRSNDHGSVIGHVVIERLTVQCEQGVTNESGTRYPSGFRVMARPSDGSTAR